MDVSLVPASLIRDISPPPIRRSRRTNIKSSNDSTIDGKGAFGNPQDGSPNQCVDTQSTTAAVEAGYVQISDHLEFFSKHLMCMKRVSPQPTMNAEDFRTLFQRNRHAFGHHFVIHQHDHPISGVHYDLRLQFSESSTISFAVPYGLPGNPNSRRPNRMAIETRVHNLWNNLIESASHSSGTLLIWDTGEYEVLPRRENQSRTTDDEQSDANEDRFRSDQFQTERLFRSFQDRHITLRLHGARLPPKYTIALRLPLKNNMTGPSGKPSMKKLRRMNHNSPVEFTRVRASPNPSSTESEQEEDKERAEGASDVSPSAVGITASDDDEYGDAAIRSKNAYPGSNNTIGSVHQRKWFLALDRKRSGFHKSSEGSDQARWIGGWGEPFFVRGRDFERSVVTGRSADEIMSDEGVDEFVGRKMWRPIME
ncbi:hypothetical protein M433DRAFT_106279 [Acidomyces richmondensis BFW]|nr:MAG: hypothetical protein FE78DRAFT_160863 [Acidomyces sp. 'richmondensis']KYG46480.1 hypothetical protein M433DRAFT_106279 [Acidomyces richmondensis BFW]